jgi:hypothetical protein
LNNLPFIVTFSHRKYVYCIHIKKTIIFDNKFTLNSENTNIAFYSNNQPPTTFPLHSYQKIHQIWLLHHLKRWRNGWLTFLSKSIKMYLNTFIYISMPLWCSGKEAPLLRSHDLLLRLLVQSLSPTGFMKSLRNP